MGRKALHLIGATKWLEGQRRGGSPACHSAAKEKGPASEKRGPFERLWKCSGAFFDDPDGYEKNPISNGPYKFVEWEPNQHVILEKWDGFEGDDAFSGGANRVEAKIYTSVDSAYTD